MKTSYIQTALELAKIPLNPPFKKGERKPYVSREIMGRIFL
jgi:hypothetical protein